MGKSWIIRKFIPSSQNILIKLPTHTSLCIIVSLWVYRLSLNPLCMCFAIYLLQILEWTVSIVALQLPAVSSVPYLSSLNKLIMWDSRVGVETSCWNQNLVILHAAYQKHCLSHFWTDNSSYKNLHIHNFCHVVSACGSKFKMVLHIQNQEILSLNFIFKSALFKWICI